MKSQLSLFLITVALFGLFSPVVSWGAQGHQCIGQIAEAYITPTTAAALVTQLNGYTLANISTWPDEYDHTSIGHWSEQNHYVDLPNAALHFEYEACFPPMLQHPGCVITAITNYTTILKARNEDGSEILCEENYSSEEPCPLSFLVHFIGDSHQPLHVAFGSDEGGNQFSCSYMGECTEIHAVWDDSMIYTYQDDNDVDYLGMASTIIDWINTNPSDDNVLRQFTNITRVDFWGSETFALARFIPYNLSPANVNPAQNWLKHLYKYINKDNGRVEVQTKSISSSCEGPYVGYNYYQKNIYTVFEQLGKAGVRLAYQLNTIFDPEFNGF